MLKITNRIRGQVRVAVTGAFPERFLNICAGRRVPFWSVTRPSDDRIEAALHASNYEKARELAEKSGCEIKLISQKGIPFFLARFKSRYALLAGLLLCLAVMGGANQFVWEIEIEGSAVYSDEEILQALSVAGIGEGMRSRSVDIAFTRHQMLLRLPELSWITVNIKGSRATVVVRDRVPKPEIFPRNIPCNIVAAKAGLIERIDTLSGSAHVVAGQTVREGQLLVSGIIDSARLGARLVHARADVTARTWYDFEAVTPLEVSGKAYTGREKTRSAIIIAGNRINLYREYSQPFEYCDKIIKVSKLKIPPDLVFPVTLVNEVFREYTPVGYGGAPESARDIVTAALEARLEAKLEKGKIISKNITFEQIGGSLYGRLEAECLEKIAVSVQIPAENLAEQER